MNFPFLSLVLLLCAILVLVWFRRRGAWQRSDAPWPLHAKRPLPSPEQVLHLRLASALPGHIILARVHATAVLGVRLGFDARLWRRRLRHLQYDFVVCAKDATVLAAIALSEQARDENSPREWAKDQASAAAGVRLIRWQKKALPDLAAIQAVFAQQPMPAREEIDPAPMRPGGLPLPMLSAIHRSPDSPRMGRRARPPGQSVARKTTSAPAPPW